MQIIHDLYAPEIAMLPIGDHFTMSPREAAYACNLVKPKAVIPMHFGTFPMLVGRPTDLQRLLGTNGPDVVEMKPGRDDRVGVGRCGFSPSPAEICRRLEAGSAISYVLPRIPLRSILGYHDGRPLGSIHRRSQQGNRGEVSRSLESPVESQF